MYEKVDNLIHSVQLIPGNVRWRIRNWKYERDIRPGDFYEDCRYHPMICHINEGGDLTGVSMITGEVGCCAMDSCGVVKFSGWREAQEAKKRYLEGSNA